MSSGDKDRSRHSRSHSHRDRYHSDSSDDDYHRSKRHRSPDSDSDDDQRWKHSSGRDHNNRHHNDIPSNSSGNTENKDSFDPVKAALEAAARLEVVEPPPVKRSLFSQSVMRRKFYLPLPGSYPPDLNYTGLFSSPFKALVERTEQVTLSIEGHQKQESKFDEPVHLVVSAGNEQSLARACARIEPIINDFEVARRAMQEYGVFAPTPASTPDMSSTMSSLHDNNNNTESIVMIPCALVGLVIGRNGESLRQLQDLFHVNIQIAKENAGNTMMREAKISGDRELIDKAKAAIDDIVRKRNVSHVNDMMSSRDGFEKFPIPNDRVGLVIGRKGATVKDIMSRTATNVTIPQVPDTDNPNVRTIIIRGDPNGVKVAKREILDVCEGKATGHSGANGSTISIPDDKVGLIIGKQGSTIRDIQSSTGARIQVPQSAEPGTVPPMRQLAVFGSPEQIELVRVEINRIIGVTVVNANPYHSQQHPFQQPPAFMGMGPDYGADPAMAGYYKAMFTSAEVPTDPSADMASNHYMNAVMAGAQVAPADMSQEEINKQWQEFYAQWGYSMQAPAAAPSAPVASSTAPDANHGNLNHSYNAPGAQQPASNKSHEDNDSPPPGCD